MAELSVMSINWLYVIRITFLVLRDKVRVGSHVTWKVPVGSVYRKKSPAKRSPSP
jgi:hypothetical protein